MRITKYNKTILTTDKEEKSSIYHTKLNGTHQLLVHAENTNLLGDNMDTVKKTHTF
jgi:N-acetylglutamate synthase/N-acetylornithine aminotransferase